MKKNKNIIKAIICMVLCFVLLSNTVLAAEEDNYINGSSLSHEKEAKDIKPLKSVLDDPNIDLYGDHLSKGAAYISNEGNGVVYIAGETYCYSTCDTISVTIYLQRLINGSWQTVSSRSHTARDTYFTSYGISLSVTKGYYYRVTGVHTATKNGVRESTTTATSGLYID